MAVLPSYIDALARSVPISWQTSVWNSKIACERALRNLGLVRRVGGVELRAQQQLVDEARGEVPVSASAEERRQTSTASAFWAASAPRWAIRSGSESAGGRSSSRRSRTAAGTGSNSASMLGTPMASSIRRTSASVLGM